MTRDGFIDVTFDGTAAEYTARCGCGWAGVEETAVEWSDVALTTHLAAHGQEEAA